MGKAIGWTPSDRVCPDDETLRSHLLGNTRGDLADALDHHFVDCSECLSRAQTLEGSDKLVSQVAKVREDAMAIDERTQALIDRWKQHPSSSAGERPGTENNLVNRDLDLPGFRIIEEIGKGGMGIVFKAEDLKLKRFVALKVILSGSGNAELLRRFRSEAEAVARLTHPNIVRIYEVGETANPPYLSLEYVDGPNLADLQKREPLTIPAAAQLIEGIARTMHHAHQAGVVHRDLKPSNVLVTLLETDVTIRDSRVARKDSQSESFAETGAKLCPKIVDFGLAKLLDTDSGHTQSGMVLGTPGFMSPEQAAGKVSSIDERSDVYSMGAMLFELLVGRPPFVGESHGETLLMVINDDVVPPNRLRPRLPLDLNTICIKCLEKEPENRYASAELLAEDLQRFREGRAILARPIGLVNQSWRWCRRNPLVASLTTTCLLLLVAGVFVVGFKNYQLAQANDTLSAAENRATRAQRAAELQRDEARRSQAELVVRDGLRLTAKDRIPQGLHTLLEGLSLAAGDSEVVDLERVARTNIGAWIQWVPEFRRPLAPPDHKAYPFALNRDESKYAVVTRNDKLSSLSVCDLETDRRLGEPISFEGRHISQIVFLPGEMRLAVATRSMTETQVHIPGEESLHIVDAEAGKISKTLFIPDQAIMLWVPKSDRYLAAFCYGPDLLCWSTSTWELLGQKHLHEDVHGFDEESEQAVLANGTRVQLPAGDRIDRSVQLEESELPAYVHQSHQGLVAYRFENNHMTLRSVPDSATSEHLPNVFSADIHPIVGQHRFPRQEQLDGRRVLGQMVDRALHSWDLATGRHFPSRIFDGNYIGPGMLTSDEQTMIASWRFSLGRPLSRPFTALDGKQTLQTPPGSHLGLMVQRVVFDQTKRKALIREYDWGPRNSTARILDTTTGQPLGKPIEIRGNDLRVIRFSPDDRLIATSGHNSSVAYGEVNLWDAETGEKVLGPLRHANWVSTVEFSPDGKTLAAGDYQGQVRLWDVTTGNEVRPPIEDNEIIWSLAWSADGRLLAVGTTGDFNQSPHIRVWDIERDVCLGELEGRAEYLDFTKADKSILVASFGQLRLWDFGSQRVRVNLTQFPQDLRDYCIYGNGEFVATATGDGKVTLRDTLSGKTVAPPLQHRAAVTSIDVCPDESMLIAGTDDGNAQLWDLDTCLPLGPPVAHSHPIARVAFTFDGSSFITVSHTGHVRKWPIPKPAIGTPELLKDRLQLWTLMEPAASRSHAYMEQGRWNELRDKWRSLNPKLRESVSFYAPTSDLDWHLARVADAEEDSFKRTCYPAKFDLTVSRHVARWHLTRLIEMEPDNWLHYARLARAHHGDFEAADLAYEKCSSLCKDQVLINWYRHRVRDCELAEDAEVAKWYLDRLVAAGVNDADIYEKRARAYEALGDWGSARADEEAAVQAGACDDYLIDLAIKRGEDQEWEEANRILGLVHDPTVAIPQRVRNIAVIRLASGNTASFVSLCNELVEAARHRKMSPTQVSAIADALVCGPCDPTAAQQIAARIQNLGADGYKIKQQIRPQERLRRMLVYLTVRAGDCAVTVNDRRALSVEGPSVSLEHWLDEYFLALGDSRLDSKPVGKEVIDSLRRTLNQIEASDFWIRRQYECMLNEIESAR